jgi:hypothetical protein
MDNSPPKIAFITAIYGGYETSCKKFMKQSMPTDFICFTDNPNITNNGWIIDTTPYHILNASPIDNGNYINSIKNNNHTFNVAKYYKQAFQNIPRLKNYDVIIWLDGTIEIICEHTSRWILNNYNKYKIIGWHHEYRFGNLESEVNASITCGRYCTTFWNNQSQPYQDVEQQYNEYVKDGYDELLWKELKENRLIDPNKTHYGVWITCFVVFDNKSDVVTDFLNMWYLQTLKYTTQDQISFPYVVQKIKLYPYTLPNGVVLGKKPHEKTLFYIKQNHGK